MKLYLPHINYTVHVKRMSATRKPFSDALASTHDNDKRSCTIYLPAKAPGSVITHEIVHALQFIARSRGMDFYGEMEHFGYIAQYLFMRITGGQWDNRA